MLDLENLPPRLRRVEAAEYLQRRHGIKRTPGTLAWLACHGGGPRFRRVGYWPHYDIADLDQWAADKMSRPVSSTSELSGAARC